MPSATASGLKDPTGGALAEVDALCVGSEDRLAGVVGVALPGTALAVGATLSVDAGLAVGAEVGLVVMAGVEVGPAPVGDGVCAPVHAAVSRTTASSATLFTQAWCRNQPIGAAERLG